MFSFSSTNWSFPAAGALSFFGGEAASSTLITNHASGQKVVPSLYNSPGTVALSQKLSALSHSRTRDAQHKGVGIPLANLLALPTNGGPKFTATRSGTRISHSGDVAKILLDVYKDHPTDVAAGGRVTVPTAVTVVDLHTPPAPQEHPRVTAGWSIFRLLPITASVVGCVFCALSGDTWSAAMIAVGMLSTGFASHALSAGDLTFTRPKSAPGVPPGDGYLETDNEIVVLRGEEGAVAAVTRGELTLRFKSESQLYWLTFSSNLLSAQAIAQLLFVPFGSSVGQLTFLATLGISWLYNLYVAAREKQAWHRTIIEDVLKKPTVKRYALGTRAATAVFVIAMLKPTNVEKQLLQFIPNETAVWSLWRRLVAQALETGKHDLLVPGEEWSMLSVDEQRLLETLLGDARTALDTSLRS